MSHFNREKTVGVIGGLGPKATLDFYGKLIERTEAQTDQDHLQVIINSNPKVPNRHQSIAGTGPSCIPSLVDSARSLKDAGADFLVMVCNTAHAYENVIRAATGLPFLSIIDESVQACTEFNPGLRKVGLLAADGCLSAGLYQNRFSDNGIESVLPTNEEQAILMELIFRIKSGERGPLISMQMESLAQSLIDRGAEVILAACTEIPLVLNDANISQPLINSTDALVEAVIRYVGQPNRQAKAKTALPKQAHLPLYTGYVNQAAGFLPQRGSENLVDYN